MCPESLTTHKLLKQACATLRTPLYRNEQRQVDRVWCGAGGAVSFWMSSVTGWLVTWGFALSLLWVTGPHAWLATVPVVFILAQVPAWGSPSDMAVLLHRERRDYTLESLLLTTADRQSLLWTKLLTGLRANLLISMFYIPPGRVGVRARRGQVLISD